MRCCALLLLPVRWIASRQGGGAGRPRPLHTQGRYAACRRHSVPHPPPRPGHLVVYTNLPASQPRRFDEAAVMSRCSKCNAAAFERVEPRERARPHVPPHVFDLVRPTLSWGADAGRALHGWGAGSVLALSIITRLSKPRPLPVLLLPAQPHRLAPPGRLRNSSAADTAASSSGSGPRASRRWS